MVMPKEVPLVGQRRRIAQLEQEIDILKRQLGWARAQRDSAQDAAAAYCRKKDSLERPLEKIRWITRGVVVPEEKALDLIREIVEEEL
jgi:hypothetical protein